jgi:hypothetical protein
VIEAVAGRRAGKSGFRNFDGDGFAAGGSTIEPASGLRRMGLVKSIDIEFDELQEIGI